MTRVSIMKYAALAFGVLFLGVAIISAKNTRTFIDQASSAQGTVIELVSSRSSNSNTYAPVIRFVTETGEAIEFKSDTSSNPPSYAKGESVKVLYHPLTPYEARIDGFASLWASSIIFGALGAVFFAIGAGMIVFAAFAARKAADLKLNGKRILTTVQRVELNENLHVNGRHPYRVFTQWKNPASSEARVFESSYVWFDPSAYLDGRSITVFVDPGDPSRYYVDLSFLPESAQ